MQSVTFRIASRIVALHLAVTLRNLTPLQFLPKTLHLAPSDRRLSKGKLEHLVIAGRLETVDRRSSGLSRKERALVPISCFNIFIHRLFAPRDYRTTR